MARSEVHFIALAAMICGMGGFDDFERFAKLKLHWLRRFLSSFPTAHGPSSDDPFRRIFTALDPKSFVAIDYFFNLHPKTAKAVGLTLSSTAFIGGGSWI